MRRSMRVKHLEFSPEGARVVRVPKVSELVQNDRSHEFGREEQQAAVERDRSRRGAAAPAAALPANGCSSVREAGLCGFLGKERQQTLSRSSVQPTSERSETGLAIVGGAPDDDQPVDGPCAYAGRATCPVVDLPAFLRGRERHLAGQHRVGAGEQKRPAMGDACVRLVDPVLRVGAGSRWDRNRASNAEPR